MQVLQGEQGHAGNSPSMPNVNLLEHEIRELATCHSASDGSSFPAWERILEEPISGPSNAGISNPHDLFGALKSAFLHRTSHIDRSIRPSGPVQFIVKLLEFWKLDKFDAGCLLGFEEIDADYVDRILEGTEYLRGRDVRERISHLFWIRKSLRSLFRDLEVENEWLRESHALLGGRSPMSLLLGGSMDDLELTREYVDTVASR